MGRRNDRDDGSVAFVPSSIPPWHMWGNTQIIELRSDQNNTLPQSQSQLIKVAHSRPDTWQWLFQARILEAPLLDSGGQSANIHVYWDVATGLGRSAVQLIGFDHWWWTWAVGDPLLPVSPPTAVMWATSTFSPPLGYGLIANGTAVPQTETRRAISQILGQDIQVNVRAEMNGSPGLAGARLEVSAYMTPNCGAPTGR